MREDLNGFERQVADQSEGWIKHSFNLTNQDFYVRLVDEEKQSKESVFAARPLLPSQNSRAP